jgi:hypothetical protein
MLLLLIIEELNYRTHLILQTVQPLLTVTSKAIIGSASKKLVNRSRQRACHQDVVIEQITAGFIQSLGPLSSRKAGLSKQKSSFSVVSSSDDRMKRLNDFLKPRQSTLSGLFTNNRPEITFDLPSAGC